MREGSGEDEAEAAAVGEPGGVAEGGGEVAGDSVLGTVWGENLVRSIWSSVTQHSPENSMSER